MIDSVACPGAGEKCEAHGTVLETLITVITIITSLSLGISVLAISFP